MNITKNIINQPKSQVDVQITVPWSDLEPKWNEIAQKLSAEVEVPGFRKGQAPADMVEPKIAAQLQQDFLQAIMPQALMEALQGSNVVPIDYPQYQVTSFSKGNALSFTAKVTQRPVIQVGNYKGVKVPRPAQKPITDEEVSKIIDDLYKRWKLKNPSSATAGLGQVSQPSSTQPTQVNDQGGSLSFGDGSTTPSAQGSSDSQQVDQASASDQPASPAGGPDDIFAKGVGAESLVDLRTKIKQDLENEAKYNNELDYEEAILQEVEKITTVEIPDILIEDELNRMLVSLQRSVTERGLLLDEYLKTQKKTVEELKAEWKPQSERNVRMELGLSEVARQEGVAINDDELQSEIDKIQDQRVKGQFAQEEPRVHLRHALRQTKTLNLLKTLVG